MAPGTSSLTLTGLALLVVHGGRTIVQASRVENVADMVIGIDAEGSIQKLQAESGEAVAAGEWTLLHLTDMQYGLKNGFADVKTDAPERAVVQSVVANYMKESEACKYDMVFIGGDMQDAYMNNDKNPPVPKEKDEEAGAGSTLGEQQRNDLVTDLKKAGSKFANKWVMTGGNHDLGDVVDGVNLKIYQDFWSKQPFKFDPDKVLAGSTFWYSAMKVQSQLVFSLTSQFYWTGGGVAAASNDDRAKYAKLQDEFIDDILAKNKDFNSIVILTHIPPFMADIDETHGWANWNLELRKNTLSKFIEQGKPITFVTGHFHGTVYSEHTFQSKSGATVPMQIIVTTAVGTTIHWGGNEDFTPATAAQVAEAPTGFEAFKTFIGNNFGLKDSSIEKAAFGVIKFNSGGFNKGASAWMSPKGQSTPIHTFTADKHV